MNPWFVLAAAIMLEVAGTLCLKVASSTTGLARVPPGIGVAVFYISTFVLMSIAMKSLDVGITYAVWAGAGTAIITIAGIVLFGESFAWAKILGTALIVACVIVLHAAAPHAHPRGYETSGPADQPRAPAER